jgi:hypothetical protein
LVWYASPKWTKTLIVQSGYDAVDGELGDVDRDGDLDVVMGGVLWYENPRPGGNPAEGPWRSHRIGSHRSHDVEVGDLDADGDLDVVTRGQSGFGSKEGNRIHLWRQDSPDKWTHRIVECPHGEGLKVADIDRDGDLDVLIGGRWYENTGDIENSAWTEHVFTTRWDFGDCKVDVGDMNGDKRVDVILTPAEGKYRIAWYEAPADPQSGNWRERVVEPEIEGVHSLQVADMDGDGDADIVSAKMHQYSAPQEVSVYVNGGNGGSWDKKVLSTKGSHNVFVADIGNDGDLDILGANWSGEYQPIELWLNRAAQILDE